MPLKRHDRNMFCFSLCYRWSVRRGGRPCPPDRITRRFLVPAVPHGGFLHPCVGGGVLDAPSVHRKILRSPHGPSGTPAPTTFYRRYLRLSRSGSCVRPPLRSSMDAPLTYRQGAMYVTPYCWKICSMVPSESRASRASLKGASRSLPFCRAKA